MRSFASPLCWLVPGLLLHACGGTTDLDYDESPPDFGVGGAKPVKPSGGNTGYGGKPSAAGYAGKALYGGGYGGKASGGYYGSGGRKATGGYGYAGSKASGGYSYSGTKASGGYSYGGAKASGGWNSGGYSYGGTKASGGWNSGGYSYGGKASGGWNSGGYSYGGKASGGWNSGGWNSGGWPSGGWPNGGWPNGGWPNGGWPNGGWPNGGWNSGGLGTGGTNTGGLSTGGVSTGGGPPTCISGSTIACVCYDGSPGAQVCQADGTYALCVCLLTETRKRLVGSWAGVRTTPWDGSHNVTMTFASDGRYSAQCADGCIVLYYGSNDDSTEKTYQIDQVNSDGVAAGEIVIWFGTGNTDRGEITSLTFSADGNTLTFTVWRQEYGPIEFTLQRQVQS